MLNAGKRPVQVRQCESEVANLLKDLPHRRVCLFPVVQILFSEMYLEILMIA